MRLVPLISAIAFTLLAGSVACARNDVHGDAPLSLERTIQLPDVSGRIDHLAIDPHGARLAVAELENNSVDVIDIAGGTVAHRIAGLRAPQGLAFDQSGALLVVAERGSGAVRVFDTQTFEPVATIALGADADNVRIDTRNGHAIVGYGDGALAVIDLRSRTVLARIPLPAHPEGFQIDQATGRLFVNLPARRTIGVVDLDTGALITTWRLPALLWNYPLALDPADPRLAVAFRAPARLVFFDRDTSEIASSQPTCGNSDDLFFDARRRRLYVACGGGAVDAFDLTSDPPRALRRTRTSNGARTALFAPQLDRLFVAARAERGTQASILVLRPAS